MAENSWIGFWHAGGKHAAWIKAALATLFAFLFVIPVFLLLVFRFVPVPGTPQMLFSWLAGEGAHYRWRDSTNLPPYLARMVLAAEDQLFCAHSGFDWKNISKALDEHDRNPNKRLRGASTLSQQTARSVFLLSSRSWLRKGAEAYLTVLIEALWPKERILLVYLNVVDWGHGNFGAEAASRAYFRSTAAKLSLDQAARLAAILPNPDKWNAAQPGPYVARRAIILQQKMHQVKNDGLDGCIAG
jgi:monofunctional biosynthetic peptidoglycan transglycosylase